jgi:hypothetical protein
MTERRDLSFSTLDEILPEVDRLLTGHVTTGNWTLGQILHHLATAFRLTLLGRVDSPPSNDQSDTRRRRFFRARRFSEGAEVPHPALVPPVDADAREQSEVLHRAIARFESASEPFPAHPVLGLLTREEWNQFHCIHCAHHLSFVTPTTPGSAASQ